MFLVSCIKDCKLLLAPSAAPRWMMKKIKMLTVTTLSYLWNPQRFNCLWKERNFVAMKKWGTTKSMNNSGSFTWKPRPQGNQDTVCARPRLSTDSIISYSLCGNWCSLSEEKETWWSMGIFATCVQQTPFLKAILAHPSKLRSSSTVLLLHAWCIFLFSQLGSNILQSCALLQQFCCPMSAANSAFLC